MNNYNERNVLKNYINNEFKDSLNKKELIEVTCPHDGRIIGKVPVSNEQDIELAVKAAEEAFKNWGNKTVKDRCTTLRKMYEKLECNTDHIVDLIVMEHGKTKIEALGSFKKGLETLDYAIGLAPSFQGNILEVSRGIKCEDRRVPLGVVVSIVPFNFPIMVPFWTVPIALACGNTIIVKPSEKVPMTLNFVADLLKDVLPCGIFTLVHGGATTAQALLKNPTVKAVTFVGTTNVAEKIYQACSQLSKKCLALGGAKNHLVAVPDCNVDMTAQDVVSSYSGCAGQRCMAASVLLIVGEVPNLIDLIVSKSKELSPGSENKQMGPVIDTLSKNKILNYINESEKAGVEILLDGRHTDWTSKTGTWVGPTILLHKSSNDKAMREEIFGPVLSIYQCKTLEEAFQIENANPYGNAACIYTSSGQIADLCSKRFSAGMLGVNIGVPVPREPFSFGGINTSKFGHGDITGDSGVEFFTERRKITTKWMPAQEANWLS